ncbi:MAG: Stp1/IreP family PP2C-type Ser/Thr phosphatase [Deltaproteobacteria bacterium]|nr:Stp1/IreP family PP2C-type Ser/Thr phosphatase [Deltaproteobacteria bacterium]
MQIESFALSDVGRKREKNEDSFLLNPEHNLYMVADGMGGHVGGEFASSLAVETVGDILSELMTDPEATLPESGEIKPGDFKSYLQYAITIASGRIFEQARLNARLQGMGTTAVCLLFRKNKAYIANVGDSRAYRLRGKKLDQLTTDHSLVEEQLRAGIIQPAEAKGHRLKNIITRSVGFQEEAEADISAKNLQEGDVFLLCTDGLYNLVSHEEISDVLLNQNLKNACRHLVDIANSRGGDDNITVILTQVTSLDASEEEESTMRV